MNNLFITIEEAIATLKMGKMIILMDDENRENEGDLVIAADFVTSESINFFSLHGRGLICLSMEEALVDHLQLPPMATKNGSPYGTAFTISIEAAKGVSTGISTKDRAHTIKVAIDPKNSSKDLVSPGHVFPLRARNGGVLKRAGQTEGSVDLARLAGLTPAAVICEIMNADGTMSRLSDLATFSREHNIPLVTIRSLRDYRIKHESLVEVAAQSSIPMQNYGNFAMTVFSNELDVFEHFSLVKKPFNNSKAPLVRIHSECITGDVFGSCKCDCGAQLSHSLNLLSKEGGILIYLRQEGRGIGLANKLKAYALQEQGFDTVDANLKLGLPADDRDYAVAYQILKHFDIKVLRLLTNNPKKIENLEKYGLIVSERVPLAMQVSSTNREYLKTKQLKLGHLLAVEE